MTRQSLYIELIINQLMNNMIKVIYTRTSSITTFKKDSPDRQIAVIRKKYRGLKDDTLILKDNCRHDEPLTNREQFKKILSLALKYKVVKVYIETPTRISRSSNI